MNEELQRRIAEVKGYEGKIDPKLGKPQRWQEVQCGIKAKRKQNKAFNDAWKKWRIGSPLRTARVRAGLTIKQMAEVLGVSQATYYRWEEGTNIPSRMINVRERAGEPRKPVSFQDHVNIRLGFPVTRADIRIWAAKKPDLETFEFYEREKKK